MNDSREGARVNQMRDGTEYRAHSMIHKATVQMDPTKLDMLDGFERVKSGYKFVPEDTNVRLIISGRDWAEKGILVYGCQSTSEASEYIEIFIDRVQEIGHNTELTDGPEIVNIAVSGDLGKPLQLEEIVTSLRNKMYEVEYEPEQFPAVIIKIKDPSATFLLFSTGKFSIQGVQDLEDIESLIIHIKSLVGVNSENED